MTDDLHARLLAEIERREGMHKATLPMRDIVDRHQDSESLAYLAALRKLLDGHDAWTTEMTDVAGRVIHMTTECDRCQRAWPCPTVAIIAEALDVPL